MNICICLKCGIDDDDNDNSDDFKDNDADGDDESGDKDDYEDDKYHYDRNDGDDYEERGGQSRLKDTQTQMVLVLTKMFMIETIKMITKGIMMSMHCQPMERLCWLLQVVLTG